MTTISFGTNISHGNISARINYHNLPPDVRIKEVPYDAQPRDLYEVDIHVLLTDSFHSHILRKTEQFRSTPSKVHATAMKIAKVILKNLSIELVKRSETIEKIEKILQEEHEI